jgi:hypothetical protein
VIYITDRKQGIRIGSNWLFWEGAGFLTEEEMSLQDLTGQSPSLTISVCRDCKKGKQAYDWFFA